MSLAPATACAASKSTQIRITASVSAYVRIDVLQQQQSLAISDGDIQRGYVDVPAGTHLRARTNLRNGFVVQFTAWSGVYARARVTGIGGASEIGPAGGTVHVAYAGPDAPAQLSYRFYLAEGVRAGIYPWPLQMSAAVSY